MNARPDDGKAFRIDEPQGSQQYGIDEGKDRGASANTEGERQYGNDCKSRRPRQGSPRVADILKKRVHQDLFVPQGDDRIDAGRTSRRNKSGKQGAGDQYEHGCPERREIICT